MVVGPLWAVLKVVSFTSRQVTAHLVPLDWTVNFIAIVNRFQWRAYVFSLGWGSWKGYRVWGAARAPGARLPHRSDGEISQCVSVFWTGPWTTRAHVQLKCVFMLVLLSNIPNLYFVFFWFHCLVKLIRSVSVWNHTCKLCLPVPHFHWDFVCVPALLSIGCVCARGGRGREDLVKEPNTFAVDCTLSAGSADAFLE